MAIGALIFLISIPVLIFIQPPMWIIGAMFVVFILATLLGD